MGKKEGQILLTENGVYICMYVLILSHGGEFSSQSVVERKPGHGNSSVSQNANDHRPSTTWEVQNLKLGAWG